MSAVTHSILMNGMTGTIVDIECHLSNNLPRIVIVGFANKAVEEAKERIRGAFADSGIILPRKRITINLAPADLPKSDSGFDLAIAVSILVASGQLAVEFGLNEAFIGELGLDGSVRAVRGIIGKIIAGRAHGISTFYVPAANLSQAQLVPHVSLIPVQNLFELYGYLSGTTTLTPVLTGDGIYDKTIKSHNNSSSSFVQVDEVIGQGVAKRALEIAAAGGHNVLFSGPPGTGKSMLARAIASILPPLSREEMLEVTQLHSLAGHDYERIVADRPFRAPHHSASHTAITGGGSNLRPGEISLSHRGVLFLDELPEFGRSTLEALRQPLEDGVISIARAKDVTDYPANFIMVGTNNPCPCGYYGAPNGKCRCHPYEVSLYQRRMSGPIMDRIDLYTQVTEVDHERLLSQTTSQPDQNEITVMQRVLAARRVQEQRFGASNKLNASMSNADIKRFAQLEHAATALLNRTARSLGISARAYMRTIKVARTIADLCDSATITEGHIQEALAYRRPTINV